MNSDRVSPLLLALGKPRCTWGAARDRGWPPPMTYERTTYRHVILPWFLRWTGTEKLTRSTAEQESAYNKKQKTKNDRAQAVAFFIPPEGSKAVSDIFRAPPIDANTR